MLRFTTQPQISPTLQWKAPRALLFQPERPGLYRQVASLSSAALAGCVFAPAVVVAGPAQRHLLPRLAGGAHKSRRRPLNLLARRARDAATFPPPRRFLHRRRLFHAFNLKTLKPPRVEALKSRNDEVLKCWNAPASHTK